MIVLLIALIATLSTSLAALVSDMSLGQLVGLYYLSALVSGASCQLAWCICAWNLSRTLLKIDMSGSLSSSFGGHKP
ncbi:hypothetical protein C8N43_2075 [Litoreibacter ponti]|uniref:Uncharacterized protein n=1 Tax=Litoreibacter ponti TaxID=1510457 RepID=A0A2T6BMU7_9RHOB|nr:hypothetical protein C8N43_2075 [Litoreibacter ponti]